ncbi:hypothetical protein VTN00DRAFT_4215 [Thermoascus crustaceus]|uniref:uncharacterized protein n=1 Tax=Thermoascus crustaceus TaxID=5088 RepID=UPI0037427F2B
MMWIWHLPFFVDLLFIFTFNPRSSDISYFFSLYIPQPDVEGDILFYIAIIITASYFLHIYVPSCVID